MKSVIKIRLIFFLLGCNFEAAVAKAFTEEDEAMIKAMKVVYWLASENLPLSKYESLMQLLKDLEVPKIASLKIRVDYESYYTANEILSAISSQIDEEVNEKIEDSPVVTLLSDESRHREQKANDNACKNCRPQNICPRDSLLERC